MNQLNQQLYFFLHSLAGRSPVGDWWLVFCAQGLGYLIVGVLILGALFYWSRPRVREAALTSAGIAGLAWVLSEAVKWWQLSSRPFAVLPDSHILFTTSRTTDSFPSDHAAFFFALAIALAHYDQRLGNLAAFLALIITAARVAAGVHWPVDILGGLAAAIIAAALFRLTLFLLRRHI